MAENAPMTRTGSTYVKGAVAALAWLCALLLAPNAVAGQPVEPLTARDSAVLHIAILRTVLEPDSVPFAERLWLHPDRIHRQGRPAETRQLSDTIRTMLGDAFPTMRFLEAFGGAFECAPGVRYFPPVQGCAIREDGWVVDLGRIRLHGDSAEVSVTVHRSATVGRRVHSEARQWQMLFRWLNGDWVYARTIGMGVT